MSDDYEVPLEIMERLREACAHLPEAYEEQAYEGRRWRIRGRTLAHVQVADVEGGRLAYVTFHSVGPEHDALLEMGDPFVAGWGPGLVTMALRQDGSTDWSEVRELLTESYCLLAPKKLVARLGDLRPDN